MSIAIDIPNINGATNAEQLAQIRSYLYQFAGQLNWALKTLETGQGSGNNTVVLQKGRSSVPSAYPSSESGISASNFDEVKALIIKSADIVEAYYEKIDELLALSGRYVAQADFGEGGVKQYIEDTRTSIEATSESLTQNYYKKETINTFTDNLTEKMNGLKGTLDAQGKAIDENGNALSAVEGKVTGLQSTTDEQGKEIQDSKNSISAIDGRVSGIEKAVKIQEGYIKNGNVGSIWDADALGIEIGEYDTENGVTTNRFARFTSYGLELFGSSKDVPVAYVHQRKLFITNAEITGTLKLGGYEIDTSNGLAFRWVGR